MNLAAPVMTIMVTLPPTRADSRNLPGSAGNRPGGASGPARSALVPRHHGMVHDGIGRARHAVSDDIGTWRRLDGELQVSLAKGDRTRIRRLPEARRSCLTNRLEPRMPASAKAQIISLDQEHMSPHRGSFAMKILPAQFISGTYVQADLPLDSGRRWALVHTGSG
jgi:hypothetical protein